MYIPSEKRHWIPPSNGIGSKTDFRRLEKSGSFGNHFQAWPDLLSLQISDYRGWLRITGRQADSPFKRHEVAPGMLSDVLRELYVYEGAQESDLMFQEIPGPDNQRLLNFEVCRTPGYLYLQYGTDQKPLRDDLLAHPGQVVTGLNAVRMLKFYLADEFEDLDELWDRFPSAAIEGSCWSQPVGVLQKRMIVWECRQY